MRKVKQKAIIKTIQPRIVEYYCDHCGKRTGTRENPKETWVGRDGDEHYCKKSKCHSKEYLPWKVG